MSYLEELNNLVSQRRSDSGAVAKPKAVDPKVFYTTLLEELTNYSVWVKYDRYKRVSGIDVSAEGSTDPDRPVFRVDMHPDPIVSASSAKTLALVTRLCSNTGVGFISRSTLVANLQMRRAKLVLGAGLRPYDATLQLHFRGDYNQLFAQQRCLIFPLKELTQRAGLPLPDYLEVRSKHVNQDHT